jgi:hypothetical protein
MLGLAALALAVVPTAVAQSPGPATKFTGFLCQIDFKDLQGGDAPVPIPPSLRNGIIVTGNTEKLCTNSAQGGNIRLVCRATIADWAGGNVNRLGVPCLVNGQQCDIRDTLPADQSQLRIDASGNATLTCFSRANRR